MLSWIFRALRLGGVLTSPQAAPSGLQMTPPSHSGTENPRKPGSPDFILILLSYLDNDNYWKLNKCSKSLHAKITDVNLSAFVYRLFHEDISPISPIIGTNFKVLTYVLRTFLYMLSINTSVYLNYLEKTQTQIKTKKQTKKTHRSTLICS